MAGNKYTAAIHKTQGIWSVFLLFRDAINFN